MIDEENNFKLPGAILKIKETVRICNWKDCGRQHEIRHCKSPCLWSDKYWLK